MATLATDPIDTAKVRRRRADEWRFVLYFVLHGFGFVGVTLLITWGLFVLFFLAIGGFSFEGMIHQLHNFTDRYLAANGVRTEDFRDLLAIAHLIVSTAIIFLRPRLARLLWRLFDISRLNVIKPLAEEPPERTINGEFKTLAAAAARIEIAPGIELGRALWTHGQALHSRRVYAGIRELGRCWPREYAPQGFLTLFAPSFRGTTLHAAGCEPLIIANRIQSPAVRDNPIKGPYLAIVVVGEYPEAQGLAPLRAYAQPIYAGNRFVPVETEFDRDVLRSLLDLRRRFQQDGIDIAIEKPVFDRLTAFGPCRPDFLLEARSRNTGDVRQIIIEAIGSDCDDYVSAKRATFRALKEIAPLVQIDRPALNAGLAYRIVAAALN